MTQGGEPGTRLAQDAGSALQCKTCRGPKLALGESARRPGKRRARSWHCEQ